MDSNHSLNHGGRSAVASETAVLAGPIALPGKSSQTDIAPRVMPGFLEGDREAPGENIERVTRRECGRTLSREQTIPKMIDRIKALFEALEEPAPLEA